MKKIYILGLLTLTALFFNSCEPTIDNPLGSGSFGDLGENGVIRYVAVGNSITAGYQDGGVYTEDGGNNYSFPNFLSKSFGMTEFNQPQIQGQGLGIRIKFYGFNSTGSPIIKKTAYPTATLTNIGLTKPYNNLGVPGAVAYDLLDTSSYLVRSQQRANPFYAHFLRNAAFGKSMLDQAIALNPNVLTLEIGANDVLGYATSGGTISTTYIAGKAVPTPAALMTQIYQGSIMKLKTALPNCKIIAMTVPNVLGTPFFNVIPWNGFVLTKGKADTLNMATKGAFGFKEGANGWLAYDDASPIKMRLLTQKDKILFTCPTDSIPIWYSQLKPIPDQYILTEAEQVLVNDATNAYNGIINTLNAISANVKVFDLNAVFAKIITEGYKVPASTTINTKFIAGEMFSLDGIHPTARGYAALTNEILKFLNTNYKSDFKLYIPQSYPGVTVYK